MAGIFSFLVLFLLFIPFFIAEATKIPMLRGYVNDYGGMISPSVEAELTAKLKKFEETDSTQLVILTIPSLDGEPIEEYSIKVVESWKIGQKDKDNGILFIVSREDRKMRIEVGRGLEGRLTDLVAGRIVGLVVKPKFKAGDFDGGFISGVSAIINETRGEFISDHRTSSKGRKPHVPFIEEISPWLAFLILLGFFIFLSIMARSHARYNKFPSNGPRWHMTRKRIGYFPLPGGYHEGIWSTRWGGNFSPTSRDGFSGSGGSFGGGGASGSW